MVPIPRDVSPFLERLSAFVKAGVAALRPAMGQLADELIANSNHARGSGSPCAREIPEALLAELAAPERAAEAVVGILAGGPWTASCNLSWPYLNRYLMVGSTLVYLFAVLDRVPRREPVPARGGALRVSARRQRQLRSTIGVIAFEVTLLAVMALLGHPQWGPVAVSGFLALWIVALKF